jgi:glycine/D-amino acid oxidase-like deaminating enzyme
MTQNISDQCTTFEASLWESTSSPGPKLESLHGEKKADIAIIGAGVAGLSTALHLAEAGCSVVVIEAKEPGSEATGKSGGLIAPDFINLTPSQVESNFGEEWGGRLIKLVATAGSQCFDLIAAHQISCDAKKDGFWTPAHNSDFEGKLRQRASEWKNRGFDVEYVDKESTTRSLGSPRYRGAIRFAEGGSLNPLAFSYGLAEAAIRQGATVYSQSPVSKLKRHGDRWHVITENGFLDVKRVVLAANGGNSALHPLMRRTVLPLPVYEFATTPLSDESRALILHEGGSFTDKQSYMFTARYDGAGRLIGAFPDILVSRTKRRLLKEARRRLERHFPAVRDLSIEHLWQGTAWLNPSLLPKVYDLQDGVLAIQACNGRGLANNTVLGKEVAAFMTSGSAKSLSIKLEEPHPVRGHFLGRYAPAFLMTLAYLKNKSVKMDS